MTIQKILLLGNPKLYQVCQPVKPHEIESIKQVVQDLHDTMMDFRATYKVGRAIAAPQIGMMKRLVYMHIDAPVVLINPVIDQQSEEMITLWDDCMSFPDLLVKLQRHKTCRITYRDLEWVEHSLALTGDLAELLQHECDHLNGILAVARAIDGNSFALRSQKKFLTH